MNEFTYGRDGVWIDLFLSDGGEDETDIVSEWIYKYFRVSGPNLAEETLVLKQFGN